MMIRTTMVRIIIIRITRTRIMIMIATRPAKKLPCLSLHRRNLD
jgi:hypothetical protein